MHLKFKIKDKFNKPDISIKHDPVEYENEDEHFQILLELDQ